MDSGPGVWRPWELSGGNGGNAAVAGAGDDHNESHLVLQTAKLAVRLITDCCITHLIPEGGRGSSI